MESVGVFFSDAADQISNIPGHVFATLSDSAAAATSSSQEVKPNTNDENNDQAASSGVRYIPSTENGVYIRSDVPDPGHSQFVDFQIILTEEELKVLLLRKRTKEREDLKDPRNKVAANSIGKAAPFVDARRLTNDRYHSEKNRNTGKDSDQAKR